MTETMTWNMQGAGTSGDTDLKWRKLGEFLTTDDDGCKVEIVALQECGLIAGKVEGVEFLERRKCGAFDIELLRWDITDGGDSAETYYITALQFRKITMSGEVADESRVNLALVSREVPKKYYTTFSEGNLRPALGIDIEGDSRTYFTAHASAAKGYNLEDLLAHVRAEAGPPFLVMGDLNRPPGLIDYVRIPQDVTVDGFTVIASGHNTHSRTNKLNKEIDYAVEAGSNIVMRASALTAWTHDMLLSDHLAVRFSS